MCPNTNTILKEFELKLEQQHYSTSSIKAYKFAVSNFLKDAAICELDTMSEKSIHDFMCRLHSNSSFSIAYKRQILVAVNKLFALNFNRNLNLSIFNTNPKTNPLPEALSITEIKDLLCSCTNIKHLCILKLLYGCGLLISEVLNLKVRDVDFDSMSVILRAINGPSVRTVPLPQSLRLSLKRYFEDYRPKVYLFQGQKKPQYSSKSIQNFVKKYAYKAGIDKNITPYMLRHSYAIHQLRKGVSLHLIRSIMGHVNLKTTERYQRVSEISNQSLLNPLDPL